MYWAIFSYYIVYRQPFYPTASKVQLFILPIMERNAPADRSQLIRFSTLAFTLLALTSFLLARVSW